jgi:hypothetical protein
MKFVRKRNDQEGGNRSSPILVHTVPERLPEKNASVISQSLPPGRCKIGRVLKTGSGISIFRMNYTSFERYWGLILCIQRDPKKL